MRIFETTITGEGHSEWAPVDRRGSSGDDYLVVVDIQGTGLVDFEFSPQRPPAAGADAREAPSIIIQHDVLKDLSESCASTMIVPFQAFRVHVKEGKPTVTAYVVQGGHHGN